MKSNTTPNQKQQAATPSHAPQKATRPNAYTVLKEEITRLARRELRGEVNDIRKLLASHRAAIADLRRRNKELEQQVRRLEKNRGSPSGVSSTPSDVAGEKQVRFSGKGLASHRKRLGLSAAEVGLLVGASGAAVYLWEAEKTRPRPAQLPALAALRSLGKREARATLDRLRGEG